MQITRLVCICMILYSMITWKEILLMAFVCLTILLVSKEDTKTQVADLEIYKMENDCLKAYMHCTMAAQGHTDPQCIRECEQCMQNTKRQIYENYYANL
jgi:hypothetical protein